MKQYLECGGRNLRRIPVFALHNDLSDVINFNSKVGLHTGDKEEVPTAYPALNTIKYYRKDYV